MADKKVIVKAKTPVKYGEQPYGIGEKFEVDVQTYEENQSLFELLGEVEEPKEEDTDGEPRDTKKSVNKKTAGDSK